MEHVIYKITFVIVTVIVFVFVIFNFLLQVLVINSSPKISFWAMALLFSFIPLSNVLEIVWFERALSLKFVVLESALI